MLRWNSPVFPWMQVFSLSVLYCTLLIKSGCLSWTPLYSLAFYNCFLQIVKSNFNLQNIYWGDTMNVYQFIRFRIIIKFYGACWSVCLIFYLLWNANRIFVASSDLHRTQSNDHIHSWPCWYTLVYISIHFYTWVYNGVYWYTLVYIPDRVGIKWTQCICARYCSTKLTKLHIRKSQ